jgi:hypothetical protein
MEKLKMKYDRRRALNCTLIEKSKSHPGYFKYDVTIGEKDGTVHQHGINILIVVNSNGSTSHTFWSTKYSVLLSSYIWVHRYDNGNSSRMVQPC